MLNRESGKPEGELHVKIIRCENLLPMDFNGSSDPYVTITLLGDDANDDERRKHAGNMEADRLAGIRREMEED